MDRYDHLHRLYAEFDADGLRAYRDLVDLFPAVDSPVALEYWQDASDELDERRAAVVDGFEDGEAMAEIATLADRDGAFTGLDVASKYGRAFDALVLDVDETLRSAGTTDNEIPREVLHLLTEFHERGVAIVVCTGQTLENVKGFAIQGLGSELFHSGEVSVVYESGAGVFTPGHGADTKRLLYDRLDPEIRETFVEVRSRALADAPESVREGCHLQGNEFNVTLKPNYDTGSEAAAEVVDAALVHLLDLLGEEAADERDGPNYARAYYADADGEIGAVLDRRDATPDLGVEDVPGAVVETFDLIDVVHYEADAAEISSLELDKAAGVEAALSVLGVTDPFVLVMGDSKTDLRVMEWAAERDAGIAAAPVHASGSVLDHVRAADDLVFGRGAAAEMLRTALVVNVLAGLDDE